MRKVFSAALLVAGILLLPVMAGSDCDAATWVVRPGNNSYGSNDGTSYGNAWPGFGRVIWGPGGVREGDTLFVCGTHVETLVVGAPGADAAKILIRGDHPQEAGVIDMNFSAESCLNMAGRSNIILYSLAMKRPVNHALIMQATRNCEVRNCTFSLAGRETGSNYTIDGRFCSGAFIAGNRISSFEGDSPAHGIIVNTGHPGFAPETSRVEGNRIEAIGGDGITAGSNVVVSDNVVWGLLNTVAHSDGIVVQGFNVTVARNTVSDCTQCIYVDSFDYGPSAQSVCNNVDIWGNLVFATTYGAGVGVTGISLDASSGGAASINSLRIYNNTVADCPFSGIAVGDRSPEGGRINNLDIRNNVLVNNGGYNRQFRFWGHPPGGLILDYNFTLNTVYDNGSPLVYLWYDQHKTISDMQAMGFEYRGISQAQPVFARYVYLDMYNDFHLAGNSPARGAGLNLGPSYALDRGGIARAGQGAWNMGAIE